MPPIRLYPHLQAHIDALSATLNHSPIPHPDSAATLAAWILARHAPRKPLHLTVICTGNSRRSLLGAVAGNIAAAYHDLPEIQFHSGGTIPSAVNSRTIQTLREIGLDIHPTGASADPGPSGEPNPVYRIRWSPDAPPVTEFSKTYRDPANPQSDYAALMVCDEADAGCPIVPGASIRISIPFPDPKTFDNTPDEPRQYAQRRDDLLRLMLHTILQVRARLDKITHPHPPLGAPPMSDPITTAVKAKYGAVALSGLSSAQAGVRAVAEAFGYTPEELHSIPAEANMGLSCGNPTASASLREGEVVVDLGSGGGLDVLLAARKVGPSGKAIGIDMTDAMIELAHRNAARAGLANVEFHKATIDQLPLPDASVDCVISNCVINLAEDKPAVFREIARVLRPGGRLAASDIALKAPLPAELANDITAYVGCIAGALMIDDYRDMLADAGFAAVEVVDTRKDLNAYAKVENQAACCPPPAPAEQGLPLAETSCCGSSSTPPTEAFHQRLGELLQRYDVNDYAASVQVFAVKPA